MVYYNKVGEMIERNCQKAHEYLQQLLNAIHEMKASGHEQIKGNNLNMSSYSIKLYIQYQMNN